MQMRITKKNDYLSETDGIRVGDIVNVRDYDCGGKLKYEFEHASEPGVWLCAEERELEPIPEYKVGDKVRMSDSYKEAHEGDIYKDKKAVIKERDGSYWCIVYEDGLEGLAKADELTLDTPPETVVTDRERALEDIAYMTLLVIEDSIDEAIRTGDHKSLLLLTGLELAINNALKTD